MVNNTDNEENIDAPEHCFPALAPASAVILILGSYPGELSLQRQRYYAHPRNSFWPILADLLAFDQALSYQQKLKRVVERNIALWDVLYRCTRSGSLDSAIEGNSVVVNDFSTFFSQQQNLKAIFFNGARAEMEFKKRVALPAFYQRTGTVIKLIRLPSTSPAMASLTLNQKRQAWKIILDYLDT